MEAEFIFQLGTLLHKYTPKKKGIVGVSQFVTPNLAHTKHGVSRYFPVRKELKLINGGDENQVGDNCTHFNLLTHCLPYAPNILFLNYAYFYPSSYPNLHFHFTVILENTGYWILYGFIDPMYYVASNVFQL